MVEYSAGTNKGDTKQGDVFNDPFRLGKVDKNYTGDAVVETCVASTDFTPAWTPLIKGVFEVEVSGSIVKYDAKYIGDNGAIGYVNFVDGKIPGTAIPGNGKIAYRYDNVIIPQNDLPIVNAKMKSIPLIAKARRVAVYYSQIAAYQAKQDYGFDLGDQLAEKACGQLAYEIDTEICDKLLEVAKDDDTLKFNKTLPVGVSKAEHYEGFSEIVENARALVYEKTKRFAPNYMLIASNVLPILTFIKGFKAANAGKINGPYLAGTLNGVKVFVTPNIEKGTFALGVNGEDMMSSVLVYAPYMTIVPTQLLGYADGSMSQGFSTLYALEVLNKDLIVKGKVVENPQIVQTHANA